MAYNAKTAKANKARMAALIAQGAVDAARVARVAPKDTTDATNLLRCHVCLDHEGCHLIGTVREVLVTPTATYLRVYFFNGEPWPLEPLADQVQAI